MENKKINMEQWSEFNHGENDFGDKRLTKRCIKIAQEIRDNPLGYINGLSGSIADIAAAYRFMENENTSFDKVIHTHIMNTYARTVQIASDASPGEEPKVLVLGDSSDIVYRNNRHIEYAKPIGNGNQNGFLLHAGLAVDWKSAQVVGLMTADVRDRIPAVKQKNGKPLNARQRAKLEYKETDVWLDAVDKMGPPIEGLHIYMVNDRGADFFEYYKKLQDKGYDFVIRAAKLNRAVIYGAEEERIELKELLERLEPQGTYSLEVERQIVGSTKQPYRKTIMEVKYTDIQIPVPQCNPGHFDPVPVSVVCVREKPEMATDRQGNPCEVLEPLEWVLFTRTHIDSLDAAVEIRDMYKQRWLIEEYFKCLKTGCGLEDSQLQDMNSIKTLCGFYAVNAVAILELKRLQHCAPERPAEQVVPAIWLRVLHLKFDVTDPQSKAKPFVLKTVGDFYMAVARLGKFKPRKSNPFPGWQTLWKGWLKLISLIEGYELSLPDRFNEFIADNI